MLHFVLSVALGLHLSPCTVTKANIAAKCGTFGVYENRETHRGRVIGLRVLVVSAKHPSGRALTWLEGGPGGGAVDTAPFILNGDYAKEFVAERDRYDEVFMDFRGTGKSHPFHCQFAPATNPTAYFAHLWDPALLNTCIASMRGYADPNQYNTNSAVDDLDDLRAALGYKRWVLDGGSYGTFAALIYIRRHESNVAGAILDGVDPPHFQALPGAPEGAQTAFDDVLVKCRSDATCRRKFPNTAEQFQQLLDRLGRPLPMTVTNDRLHKTYEVKLSKEVFVDQFRHMLYQPGTIAFVPVILDRAAHGDDRGVARGIQLIAEGFGQAVNGGANLTYSCADQIPFIGDEAIRQAAAQSFAGDLRVRAQQRACAHLNVRPMASSFDDAVRSTVPIVMLTGSDDPATPPHLAASALAYLPNAKEVIVRGAGHGAETPCTDALVEKFLVTLSAQDLDTQACGVTEKPFPFATSLKQLP